MTLTPCYDEKGLDYCECGKEPWETKNWCDLQRIIHCPIVVTPEEEAVSEYVERLIGRIKYYCENAPGLERDLKDIIYRIM